MPLSKQFVRLMALGTLLWFAAIYWVHLYVDFPVTRYIHTHLVRGGVVDRAAHIVTLFAYSGVALSVLLALFILVRFIKYQYEWTRKVLCILMSATVSGLATDLLKLFFGRPRPKLYFNHGLTEFYWWHHRPIKSYDFVSFPSGHTTTAAAIGVCIMLLLPKWRLPAIFFVLLIAASRVILLDHYMADVMAGIYVGGLTSLLFYHYYYEGRPSGRLWRWLEGRV